MCLQMPWEFEGFGMMARSPTLQGAVLYHGQLAEVSPLFEGVLYLKRCPAQVWFKFKEGRARALKMPINAWITD